MIDQFLPVTEGILKLVQNCTTNADSVTTVTPNSSCGESQALLYQYWQIWDWTMQHDAHTRCAAVKEDFSLDF